MPMPACCHPPRPRTPRGGGAPWRRRASEGSSHIECPTALLPRSREASHTRQGRRRHPVVTPHPEEVDWRRSHAQGATRARGKSARLTAAWFPWLVAFFLLLPLALLLLPFAAWATKVISTRAAVVVLMTWWLTTSRYRFPTVAPQHPLPSTALGATKPRQLHVLADGRRAGPIHASMTAVARSRWDRGW